MTDDISKLKTQRGQLKASITRGIKFYDELNKSNLDFKTISELQVRLSKIEPLLDKFENIQLEIELISKALTPDFDESIEEDERINFENSYYQLTSSFQHTIALFKESQNAVRTQTAQVPPEVSPGLNTVDLSGLVNQSVKLPTIALPKFNGEFSEWVEFRDSFKALVDSSAGLSDIQKFYYLKSSLNEKASQIIQSIQVSSENYAVAWRMLSERFEQKALIIHSHIRAIFEYQGSGRESHTELRNLFDTITKHLRSLETLGEPVSHWDSLIIYIFTSKMASETRKEWELFEKEATIPTMKDLNKFLKQRCEVLEKLAVKSIDNNKKERVSFIKGKPQAHAYVSGASWGATRQPISCYNCKNSHTIFHCRAFLSLSPNDRINVAKTNKLCFNCLRPTHGTQECTHSNCRKCGKHHNTLLHIDTFRHNNSQFVNNDNNNQSNNTSINNQSNNAQLNNNHTNNAQGGNLSTAQLSNDQLARQSYTISTLQTHNLTTEVNKQTIDDVFNSQVLLSTVMVRVQDSTGKFYNCRALLDSGSMSNFISENLCKKLNLPKQEVNYSVVGVGQARTSVKCHTNVKIFSHCNAYNVTISCLVLPKITEDLPTMSFNKTSVKLPANIKMADPNFNKAGPIDILLGSSIFWQLMCVGQIQLNDSRLTLQKTVFGWVIAGSLATSTQQINSISCHSVIDNAALDKQIVKFWQTEEVSVKSIRSQAEEICESHFVSNLNRSDKGQFIVKIPFKENVNNIGQSRELAISRFYSQERRLAKNEQLRLQYADFMSEYEELGHMKEIKNDNGSGYYIPHHAVVRDSSITTKVRVVFDASMKTDTGLSLNDVQYVGATIQNDLYSIILRFRLYNYVMTADISKMYRMILIDPEQRQFQKIFWRASPAEVLKCYELGTVSYGTASAPWLAVRCLFQLAVENEKVNPKASSTIKNDFYVDDLLTGCNSQAELVQLQRDISSILSSGGFELRKWLSNDEQLRQQFYVNDNLEAGILSIGDNEANKTLGVLWNAGRDTIQFSVSNLKDQKVVTKRSILSIVSQVYDPLGLLGPVVIVAKMIIQKLWQAKITWDEAVPQYLFTAWLEFREELPLLYNIELPRQVVIADYNYAELHVFADASERAFGSCIYIRSKNKEQNVLCKLLTAKSRVAPLKQVTLPRLELCAAVLGAQLAQKVTESMNIDFDRVHFWSDSTITLCWIKGSPAKWKTYVANRVSEIQRLTEVERWHHVPSKDNPADLISRGLSVRDLISNRLWWEGPDWLNRHDFDIKSYDTELDSVEIPEQRIITNVAFINNWSLFERYSSINKLKRVMVYILRFIFNATHVKERKIGHLTCEELENSLGYLIKLSQQESFPNEYNQLKNGKALNKKSSLLNLNPFLDSKQLMRVGGRMQNSNSEYDKKHPIILCNKHKLTRLILREEHERLLHCGPTMLLSSIRQRFWPVHGRNLAKLVVHNCVKCFKVNPHATPQYLMGNLPKCRVSQCVPFYNTGCDFAGPFLLRDRNSKDTRGCKIIKGYVCLFICLATKAIHLEAVSDLTTECFLATLKRFIGRRGKPLNIYSDNAMNFVGANIELKKLYKFLESQFNDIGKNLISEGITWHFNPPRSPNFGGIWEAGVKSAKFHLKRVVGEAHLNFEDFSTVLIQIESILNSRPLCPMSSTPDQLNPLTPAHFLIGKPLTALPDKDYMNVPENRLKRYERLQSIVQHFWSRWHKEYLGELQTRSKWQQGTQSTIKIGAIVLVKEENTPPLQWHMGRVTELHPGQDGIVRVVSVLVNKTIVKRAVSKLCIFPFDNDNIANN